MTRKLMSRPSWSFPSFRFPFSLFEESDEEAWGGDFSDLSGLTVSEDEDHVYVEAALPGIKPEEVEVTFDKGILWIKAQKKEESESKNKKFYRKAASTFSYHIAVPGNIDENGQPEAIIKNGMIEITFSKAQKTPLKKIPIKYG
jgi:HSP20 family protein